MKIASLNIAKGLHSKATAIEEPLNKNNLDILCLLEADIPSNISAPCFNGYQSPIFHTNKSNYSRIVCYVKHDLEFTNLEKDSVPNHSEAPPFIAIDLKNIHVSFIYNVYTKNAYSPNTGQKLSPERRLERFKNIVTNLNNMNKSTWFLATLT